MNKKASVYTNVPNHDPEVLRITAFVRVPIQLSPKSIFLKGVEGQTITKTLKISAEGDELLKLEPTYFDLSSKVIYRMEEVETGKTFLIHFTNIPGMAETYRGYLKLKTNYPKKPEISIPIKGKFETQKASPKGSS